MGNAVSEPVHVGVKLDKPTFEAGDTLTGRVYLQVKGNIDGYQAIHIRVEGKEHVEEISRQQVTPSITNNSDDCLCNELSPSLDRERCRHQQQNHSQSSTSSSRGESFRRERRDCARKQNPRATQSRQSRLSDRSSNRISSDQNSSQCCASAGTKTERSSIRISEDTGSSASAKHTYAITAETETTGAPKATSSSQGSEDQKLPSKPRKTDPLKVAGALATIARKAMDKNNTSRKDSGTSLPSSRKTNPLKVGTALAVNARKARKKEKRGQDGKKDDPPAEFTLRSLPPPEFVTVAEHSFSMLVQYDVLLTQLYDIGEGQYEYPFEWPLPAYLPTSMRRNFGDDCHCEIKYTLSAYLVGGPQRDFTTATTTFGVAARPSTPLNLANIQVEPTGTPIIGCCCTNHGVIYLGYEAASNVCPRDTLEIHISGENQSDAAVPYIQVALYEIVQAKSDSGKSYTDKTTLASCRCSVSEAASWQPQRPGQHSSTTENEHREALLSRERTKTASLVIPADACDSYRGRLITVRHVLEVTAATSGLKTSPSCTASLQVTRPPPRPLGTTPPVAMGIPEAQAVPVDWYAEPAEVVVLPSAPDESLLHEMT